MDFTPPDEVYDHGAVVRILNDYYEGWGSTDYKFTGSKFDAWDPSGTRASSPNVFTADDLIAVSFLSVNIEARAAEKLLVSSKPRFTELLEAVKPDADLSSVEVPFSDSWPGWQLWNELDALPGVGPTRASKLFARKRPRLRPIYDSVTETFLGPDKHQLEPIRLALRSGTLADVLERAIRDAKVPSEVSIVRALDVVCWYIGSGHATPTR